MSPSTCAGAYWAGFHRAMKDPQIEDLAADLPVLCADLETRHFACRLLVLRDDLAMAISALAICAAEETTGVGRFG